VEGLSDDVERNAMDQRREFLKSVLTFEMLGQKSEEGCPEIVTDMPTAGSKLPRRIGKDEGSEARSGKEKVGYAVRDILKHRKYHDGRRQYLVRWVDPNSNLGSNLGGKHRHRLVW